jgi:molybdopterin biosynthesis enzyme
MDFPDVLDLIDRQVRPVGREKVALLDALGRVAARSLVATRNVPPCDVSALDGYALKGPGERFPVTRVLEPFGEPAAGLRRGEAVFVPTGGRIPAATRFVPREHVIETAMEVAVTETADARKLIERGTWLRKGQPIVAQGETIAPDAMQLMALAGYDSVEVFRKPPVAIVTTGSELKKGAIVDSNRFLLTGFVRRDGGEVIWYETADDEEGRSLAPSIPRRPSGRASSSPREVHRKAGGISRKRRPGPPGSASSSILPSRRTANPPWPSAGKAPFMSLSCPVPRSRFGASTACS